MNIVTQEQTNVMIDWWTEKFRSRLGKPENPEESQFNELAVQSFKSRLTKCLANKPSWQLMVDYEPTGVLFEVMIKLLPREKIIGVLPFKTRTEAMNGGVRVIDSNGNECWIMAQSKDQQ